MGSAPDPLSSPFWRRAVALIIAVILSRGLILACVLPPFEGWDEYQHVAYVEHLLEGGGRPVLGSDVVPQVVLRAIVAYPQPHTVLKDGLARFGAVGYAEYWANPAPIAFREGTQGLYQAQHGPLFYRLALPLYSVSGGRFDLASSVSALRLLNLGFTAVAVGLVLWTVRLMTGSARTAVLLALPLAAHPLFLFNGVRVANDALGVMLATATVALGLSLVVRRVTAGIPLLARSAALGATAGLAVEAKATNLALLPFLLACTGLVVLRARGRRRLALSGAVLVLLSFLVSESPDLRFNLQHYGLPTAMQEAIKNRRDGRTVADLVRTVSEIHWSRDLSRVWLRELFFMGGWSFVRTSARATANYQLLVRLGLVGWGMGFFWLALNGMRRRKSSDTSELAPVVLPMDVVFLLLVLVASYTFGLAYHMVQSRLAWGVSTTCTWYACPALPWFLVLVVAGAGYWIPGRSGTPFAWLFAATCVAGELIGVFGVLIPTYSGLDSGWLRSATRLASLHPWWLGIPTLLMACLLLMTSIVTLILTCRDASKESEARPTAGLLYRGPHASISTFSPDPGECPTKLLH